jgi:Zn-dependent protease with chaperone function
MEMFFVVFVIFLFFLGCWFELFLLKNNEVYLFEDCKKCKNSQAVISWNIPYNPFEIIRHIATQARIMPPKFLVLDFPDLNMGVLWFIKPAIIIANIKFLKTLNEREFEGVVSHEIGHIKRNIFYKIFLLSFGGFFTVSVFLLLLSISVPILQHVFHENFFVYTRVLAIIATGTTAATIFCHYFSKVISRQSEFLADEVAMSLTRYPEEFIDVLKKIEEPAGSVKKPLLFSFFTDTHPTIKDRIKRVKIILEK